MAPAVQDAVARQYQPRGGSGRCPGEESCERFQSAAGATSEDKQHACDGCELLPTKLVTIDPTADTQAQVWRIERLACERDSGAGLSLDEISPLEFELLLVWDAELKAWERALQQRLNAVMEAMMRRGY